MDSPYRRELEVVLGAIQVAAAISRTVLHALQEQAQAQASSSSPNGTTPNGTAPTDPLHLIKSDLSPVTVADLAIQAVLLAVLSSAFPTYGLIAEESSAELRASAPLLALVARLAHDHAAQSPSCLDHAALLDPANPAPVLDLLDRAATSSTPASTGPGPVWIIDPIDGTQAFLRGHQYAINVALVVDGVQTLSVVSLPLLDPSTTRAADGAIFADSTTSPSSGGTVLFAVRSHGAWLLPAAAPAPALAAARRLPPLLPPPQAPRAVTATPAKVASGHHAVHAEVARQLGAAPLGSDLTGWVPRWCALALGLADYTAWVYKRRDRFAKIWDHAGAMLLLEEVGGVVTDVHGKPIELHRGRLLDGNFGFVGASGAALHAQVLETVRRVMRDQGLEKWLHGDDGEQ